MRSTLLCPSRPKSQLAVVERPPKICLVLVLNGPFDTPQFLEASHLRVAFRGLPNAPKVRRSDDELAGRVRSDRTPVFSRLENLGQRHSFKNIP